MRARKLYVSELLTRYSLKSIEVSIYQQDGTQHFFNTIQACIDELQHCEYWNYQVKEYKVVHDELKVQLKRR